MPNANDEWALGAKHLNESIFALEGCLRAWADPEEPQPPFEDSLLTRLLQSSLGKNSHVQVVGPFHQSSVLMIHPLNSFHDLRTFISNVVASLFRW